MQRDAGSSREPQSRSTMSQHVPMSPRARTAADIIIVYSIRPWESGRHCASPPLAVASSSWVNLECSASPVRGTRVLGGVSSPRPDSVDPVPCGGRCCVRTHIAQSTDDTLPRQATGLAAVRTSASDANAKRAGVPPPQVLAGTVEIAGNEAQNVQCTPPSDRWSDRGSQQGGGDGTPVYSPSQQRAQLVGQRLVFGGVCDQL